MHSVIIDNDLEKKPSKKLDIKINFSKIYLGLLIVIVVLIYFYLVYQNDYLLILMPYGAIWSIGIIMMGISIFRVNNGIDLAIGSAMTIVVLGLTVSSMFVYSANIENNNGTNIISTKDASSIFSDIDLVAVQATVKSGEPSTFRSSFFSNYDKIISSNYRDENKIENIKIEQTLFPPGIGAYKKQSDIVLPNDIPIELRMNANFSSIKTDLNNIQLKSGYIKANATSMDLSIENLKLEEDVILSINSNWSLLNIIIGKDIPVIISNSSSLSQSEFIGIDKKPNTSNIYQSTVQDNNTNNEPKETKRLIINLSSTLSQIIVIRK